MLSSASARSSVRDPPAHPVNGQAARVLRGPGVLDHLAQSLDVVGQRNAASLDETVGIEEQDLVRVERELALGTAPVGKTAKRRSGCDLDDSRAVAHQRRGPDTVADHVADDETNVAARELDHVIPSGTAGAARRAFRGTKRRGGVVPLRRCRYSGL
jgi:hypothetical protein